MKQQDIIESVVRSLIVGQRISDHNVSSDLPLIRESLNDCMDHHERAGNLSRKTSDKWSQKRMVAMVQAGLKK